MRENIEINIFLHRRRKICEHMKNTEIIKKNISKTKEGGWTDKKNKIERERERER